MMGVVGGHGVVATFDGDASLRKRPMRRILDPLRLMGAQVLAEAEGGRCPITLRGALDPAPILYRTPVASAQIKSAVLLAGLNARGRTTVVESEASRDHTEKMLAHFGAEVSVEAEGRRAAHHARRAPRARARPVVVPADPSSAAFPIVAALITPGSDIVVEGVMMNPLRAGLSSRCWKWARGSKRSTGGAKAARTSRTCACARATSGASTFAAARAPSMIDEYPILAVAAAFASGETRMRGLHELRVKESDRLAAVAAGLAAAGVEHEIAGDDLIVRRRPAAGRRRRGRHPSRPSHRHELPGHGAGVAKPMTVDDASMIATSFPNFRALMESLGAKFRGCSRPNAPRQCARCTANSTASSSACFHGEAGNSSSASRAIAP